jgi:Mrp family chromosome partitioning ATPase/capsular polysaccharide biosynthesis protein
MLSGGMTGYLGMDLPRFLAVVRARRLLIVGIVVAAMGLALVWSLTQPNRYEASADLLFGRTTSADTIITGGATDTADVPERTAATNLALASLDTVAANVKRSFKGPVTVQELKDAVLVEAQGASDVVTVTATWDSPATAAALANAFANEIVALRRNTARQDIQRAIDALTVRVPADPKTPGATTLADTLQAKISDLEALKQSATGNVHLVESATPPDHRSSPKPLRNAVIAGVVAAILALFVVVLLARFDDRVGDEDELAQLLGASILARIPEVGRSRRPTHVWIPDQDPSFLEAFEFLRLNLQLMGHDGGQVIAVTSPASADGKSTVVGWLARSLALSGEEVVAVDLDLRKPELHTYLNTPREPGAGVLDALLATAPDNNGDPRALIAAGRESEHSGERDSDAANGERAAQGRRVYTDDDVTVGLVELARFGGNARRAARSLKGAGRDIPESTLRRWRAMHPDVYDEIRSARARGTVAAPHLRLLTGGYHQLPPGLLARGRLEELFAQLRQDADVVLVDTVPVSTVADASVVAAAADGVILVVDLDRVRRRELLTAKNQLTNARAKLLGIVVNRAGTVFPVYHAAEEEFMLERGPAA